jgi:hypothetical protein
MRNYYYRMGAEAAPRYCFSRIEPENKRFSFNAGKLDEKNRIRKVVHTELAPQLLAAIFAVHSVRECLQKIRPVEAARLNEALEFLKEACDVTGEAVKLSQSEIVLAEKSGLSLFPSIRKGF